MSNLFKRTIIEFEGTLCNCIQHDSSVKLTWGLWSDTPSEAGYVICDWVFTCSKCKSQLRVPYDKINVEYQNANVKTKESINDSFLFFTKKEDDRFKKN